MPKQTKPPRTPPFPSAGDREKEKRRGGERARGYRRGRRGGRKRGRVQVFPMNSGVVNLSLSSPAASSRKERCPHKITSIRRILLRSLLDQRSCSIAAVRMLPYKMHSIQKILKHGPKHHRRTKLVQPNSPGPAGTTPTHSFTFFASG